MKKNWLLTTLLATVTIVMGTTTTAFASPPTDITPEHPGGVTAPHSPDGIPSNITESPRILRDQVRPAGPLQSGSQ